MTFTPAVDIFAFPGTENSDTHLDFKRPSFLPHSRRNNTEKINDNIQTRTIDPTTNLCSKLPLITKKGKRNLVSQLRSINGEYKDMDAQNHNFDFVFSNDEDNNDTADFMDSSENHNNDILSRTDSQITSTDALDYHERMEQLLAQVMTSEFGQDENEKDTPPPPSPSPSPPTLRQPYVPKNSIRAPITYSRDHIPKVSPTPTQEELYVKTLINFVLSGSCHL